MKPDTIGSVGNSLASNNFQYTVCDKAMDAIAIKHYNKSRKIQIMGRIQGQNIAQMWVRR